MSLRKAELAIRPCLPAANLPSWLVAAVFCSGAAGLMYQALWSRMLALALGSTAMSVCVILSVFMIGMAAGSRLLGGMADRARDQLQLYAAVEAGLAVCGAATPWLFRSLDGPAAVSLLLVPTMLMGGTLPILMRHLVRAGWGMGFSASMLYFWNTIGGAVGALASVFIMIPSFGVSGAVWGSAGINLAVALTALLAPRAPGAVTVPSAGLSSGDDEHGRASERTLHPWALGAVLFVSGFSALAYETLWTRLLALVFGSSVHAFAFMLSAFLGGMALGGRIASGHADNVMRRAGILGMLLVGVAAANLAALAAYPRAPFLYLKLFSLAGSRPGVFAAGQFGLALALLSVPAALMGMAFSWSLGMAARRGREGASIGAAYAANTAGAAVGPWAATFALVPILGLPGSLAAVTVLSAASGAALMWWEGAWFGLASPWAALAVFSLAISRPAVGADILHSGVSVYAPAFLQAGSDEEAWRGLLAQRKLLFWKDGAHASVSVWQRTNGQRSLVINGKADASDGPGDMATQLLLGHLPMLLSEAAVPQPGAAGRRVNDALVIGLGSGVTASAVAGHPVRRIEIVEIEPAVVEAARYFEHANHGVLSDPRSVVIVDDARRHLRRAGRRYDLMVSEPSNPWIAGMSHLFTRDFFLLARSRLAPAGIFCQWFHLHNMPLEALAAGLDAFRTAFPHAELWLGGDTDIILLGSETPLRPDWDGLETALSREGPRGDLEPLGLRHAQDMLARRAAGPVGLASLVSMVPHAVHADDSPTLEFLAPLGLRDSRWWRENIALIEQFAEPALDGRMEGDARARSLARALIALGRAAAARRQLAFVRASDPWRSGLERDLGTLYRRKGDAVRAAEVFEERAVSRPADATAWLDLAEARMACGDQPRAIQALDRFLVLAGPAMGSRRRRSIEKSLAEARRTGRSAPAHLAIGEGYAAFGRGDAAAEAFSRVLETAPDLLGRYSAAKPLPER